MLKQQTIDSLFVATQQRLYNYALHLHFKDTFLSDPYFFSSAFCEQPKPSHSYIGLIAMAILSSPERQLVLSDIYQWISDHYPYFRTRGPGWRNSIRHNLSLNDCFIKAGRSSNGKGHFWSIHPANLEAFLSGDFRRRRAERRTRANGDNDDDIEEISYYPPESNIKSRKRCFDVDSLLAPDRSSSHKRVKHETIYSPNSKSSSSIDTNLSI